MNQLPSAARYLAKAMALCFTAVIAGCGGSSMPWSYSTQGSESRKADEARRRAAVLASQHIQASQGRNLTPPAD